MPPRRPVPPTAQVTHLPAPTGGLNTVSSGTAMPAGDCVELVNLIAAENGLRSRLGNQEWVTGLTGSADNLVRTLISFSGSEPSADRRFATTSSGIWPATASTDAPAISITFASGLGEAGYGMSVNMVTAAGHFCVYCDEVNGYYLYSQTGGTWAKVAMGALPTQVDGVDPALFVACTVFKERLWFVERGSTSAWYLDLDSVYGTATEFDFGQQFRNGGYLVGLWNWTYDGGAGLDDSLVAISSSGDVVIYNGTDPDDPATFSVRGTWNMGPPPAGRDIVLDVGGDLYLLSQFGILPISQLVVGAETRRYVTDKVGNLFNLLMNTRASLRGWSMRRNPEDNSMVVLYPDYSTEEARQIVLAEASRSWSRYEGLDMHCATVSEGQLYFGTTDGRVCVSTGYVDGVVLDDPDAYTPVDWRLLSSFQHLAGGGKVRVTMLRALFSTGGSTPTVTLEPRYGYDQTIPTAPSSGEAQAGTYGVAIYGESLYGGAATSYTHLTGGFGVGAPVAVAIRGTAIDRTILVGVEIAYETGSFL
jgi:hypothetical protein